MRKWEKTFLKHLIAHLAFLLVLLFAGLSYTTAQEVKDRKIITEKQERAYYIDDTGKKKYLSNSKTQQQWNKILEMCPKAISIAEEYNVNIWQNTKYKKKEKLDN